MWRERRKPRLFEDDVFIVCVFFLLCVRVNGSLVFWVRARICRTKHVSEWLRPVGYRVPVWCSSPRLHPRIEVHTLLTDRVIHGLSCWRGLIRFTVPGETHLNRSQGAHDQMWATCLCQGAQVLVESLCFAVHSDRPSAARYTETWCNFSDKPSLRSPLSCDERVCAL